jgi:ankyrin repeat protein
MIYQTISDSGPDNLAVAEKVMKWLISAQRPLNSRELIAAISVDSGEEYLHLSNDSANEFVLDICCNMVVLDSAQDVFRFAHLSVREYLERRGDYTPFTTHTLASEKCLDVLTFGLTTPMESAVKQNSIFQSYANLYWPVHYQMAERNQLAEGLPKKLKEKLKEFLSQYCDTGSLFTKWVLAVGKSSMFSRSDDYLERLLRAASSTPPTPLFLACSFGLVSIMDELGTYANVDWNQKNDNRDTGLHLAAENGCEAVVRLLLAKDGVDPDSKDSEYARTPLSLAAESGHEAVVRLLLANDGVDPDSKDSDYGRAPLSWAARSGHGAVVQLLLAKDGVDPDSKDYHGRTPLSWAARNGHWAVVQLLLAKDGVDPDSKDYCGRTPLSWAARNGRRAVVRLLLAKDGVDPDSKDYNDGRTPLSWAARNGHWVVVRLLLGKDCSSGQPLF